MPDILPEGLRRGLAIPLARSSDFTRHFPEPGESLDALNTFRSPSAARLIFENFSCTSSARFGPQGHPQENAIAFRLREDAGARSAEAHPAVQAHGGAESAFSPKSLRTGKTCPMNRLLQGDVGAGKHHRAASTVIAIEKRHAKRRSWPPRKILPCSIFFPPAASSPKQAIASIADQRSESLEKSAASSAFERRSKLVIAARADEDNVDSLGSPSSRLTSSIVGVLSASAYG